MDNAASIASGYPREDGRLGLRNRLMVLYTVNCSAHVAHEIADRLREGGAGVDVLGNESCYDNQVVIDRLLRLAAHPNAGAALIVGHGCEFIQAGQIAAWATKHGRPAEALFVQERGTAGAIKQGVALGQALLRAMEASRRVPVALRDLRLGILQVGAPEPRAAEVVNALGRRILDGGGQVLLTEQALTGGNLPAPCELAASARAEEQLTRLTQKLEAFTQMHGERESGAPMPLGPRSVQGVCKIARVPPAPGLWIADTLQDDHIERGYPLAGPVHDVLELICCGAQIVLVCAARPPALGAMVSPIVQLETGGSEVSSGDADLVLGELFHHADPAQSLLEKLAAAANGAQTRADALGPGRCVLLQSAQRTGLSMRK